MPFVCYWCYVTFLCKDVGYVGLSWSDQSDCRHCVEGVSMTKRWSTIVRFQHSRLANS